MHSRSPCWSACSLGSGGSYQSGQYCRDSLSKIQLPQYQTHSWHLRKEGRQAVWRRRESVEQLQIPIERLDHGSFLGQDIGYQLGHLQKGLVSNLYNNFKLAEQPWKGSCSQKPGGNLKKELGSNYT